MQDDAGDKEILGLGKSKKQPITWIRLIDSGSGDEMPIGKKRQEKKFCVVVCGHIFWQTSEVSSLFAFLSMFTVFGVAFDKADGVS